MYVNVKKFFRTWLQSEEINEEKGRTKARKPKPPRPPTIIFNSMEISLCFTLLTVLTVPHRIN